MHARSIFVLLVLVTMAGLGGCQIDHRSLKVQPPGSDGSAGGSTPPTILLGDFENDDAIPPDLRFAPYQYYAYNPSFDPTDPPPGAMLSSPIVAPGDASNYALGLNWVLVDAPDGVPNYPGAGVRTVVKTGFVDLTGYDRIVFAQQYQHTGTCKALQNLTVFISCGELNTSYQGTVAVSPAWTTSSLAFKSFVEQTFAPPSGHSLGECLALADGVVFQAQVDLADGDCASGNLALDNIEIRAGSGPGPDASASAGIAIVPDGNGTFDGSNAAGVIGAWSSTGDDYSADGTAGAGTCPLAGFSQAQCSTINTPKPGAPFPPDPTGKGMCTSGVAALVAPGDGGQPAYSDIWGNFIFFDLNHPPSSKSSASDGGSDAGSVVGVYDASAHGVTGFAFDIDGSAPAMRVEFSTQGTETNAAYWSGTTANISPVNGPGHYEIRWADVGGPSYLSSPPPFDPSKLESIRFHVISSTSAATPYSYCISNTVMLTGP